MSLPSCNQPNKFDAVQETNNSGEACGEDTMGIRGEDDINISPPELLTDDTWKFWVHEVFGLDECLIPLLIVNDAMSEKANLLTKVLRGWMKAL